MHQRLILAVLLGLILVILNTQQVEGGQGCPLPTNTCRHHCVYEVRTDKGKPCGGTCKGLTCVCLYGSACRRRSFYVDSDDSQDDY